MNFSAHLRKSLSTTLAIALVLLIVPSTSHAIGISWTTPNAFKSGIRSIAAAILSLAPRGSYIAQGQFVCDSGSNSNCGLVSGVKAILIPEFSTYTATGGLKVNGEAKYRAVVHTNAFNSSASSRGLRTGTSATLIATLAINRNNTGVSYDCVLQDVNATGTGGKIVLFDNKSATGTYLYSTPFVKGPTDRVVCGTLGTPKANSDVQIRLLSLDTDQGK